MDGKRTHHIGLTEEFVRDFPVWLFSGEPARTDAVHKMLDIKRERIETGRQLPIAKGYLRRTFDGKEHLIPVGLATSGMGLGSTEITMMELVETFIKTNQNLTQQPTIIRIGTAGSHQPNVYGGDIVIADKTYTVFGAVDDLIVTKQESASYHRSMVHLLETEEMLRNKGQERTEQFERVRYDFAQSEIIETPSCNREVISYIQQAAQSLGLGSYHVGPVFSKLTLFSEASEDFTLNPEGIRQIRLEYRKRAMRGLGICASEMEIAMMTSIAHLAGLKGYDVKVGGIMAVVNNPRNQAEAKSKLFAKDEVVNRAVNKAIELGLETAVEIYKAELMRK